MSNLFISKSSLLITSSVEEGDSLPSMSILIDDSGDGEFVIVGRSHSGNGLRCLDHRKSNLFKVQSIERYHSK
jgi:hypothetical protein